MSCRKLVLVLLLAALSGAVFFFGVVGETGKVIEPLPMILDDFVDRDLISLAGDPWSLLEYAGGQGTMRISTTDDGEPFLAVEAHTSGLVGALLRFGEPRDLSAYTGLYVSVSASAPIRVKVEICGRVRKNGESVERCTNPGVRLSTTLTEHVIWVPFSSFRPDAEEMGLCPSCDAHLDPSAVEMINFQTWGLEGVTLRIHQVGFYSSGASGIDGFPTYGEPLFVIDDFEDGDLDSSVGNRWHKNVCSGEYGDTPYVCKREGDYGCHLQAVAESHVGLGVTWNPVDLSDYKGIYFVLDAKQQSNILVEIVTLEHPLRPDPLYLGAHHDVRAVNGTAEYRLPFSEFSTYPADDVAFSQDRRIISALYLWPQTERDVEFCVLEVGFYQDQGLEDLEHEVHWAGEDPAPDCKPNPTLSSAWIPLDLASESLGVTLRFDRPVEFVYLENAVVGYAGQEGDQVIAKWLAPIAATGGLRISWLPSDASLITWKWGFEEREASLPHYIDRWGFTVPWLFGADYNHDFVFQALDELIATGANDVILAPRLRMEGSGSSSFEFIGGLDAQLEGIRRVAQHLLAAGIHVSIKPAIHSEDRTPSLGFDPADKAMWFAQYRETLMAYGSLAEELGIEVIYLTNELTELVTDPVNTERWISLIDDVRSVFSGELSVNATKVEDEGIEAMEVLNIPFAEELDFIGVSLYGALTCSKDPSVAELCSAWYGSRTGLDFVGMLHRIHECYGKPVMISEIAYPGYNGVNMQLRFGATEGTPDDLEQSDCFEAAMRVLAMESSRKPGWLRGISAWAWFTLPDPTEPLPGTGWNILNGDRNAFIQNKPAQHLLATFFKLLSE